RQPKQLVLLVLARPDARMLELLVAAEERVLAHHPVAVRPRAVRERGLQRLEHPLPRPTGRVQGAAPDQRLERALVRDRRIDPLREVPQRLERPTLTPAA